MNNTNYDSRVKGAEKSKTTVKEWDCSTVRRDVNVADSMNRLRKTLIFYRLERDPVFTSKLLFLTVDEAYSSQVCPDLRCLRASDMPSKDGNAADSPRRSR